jgi:hypothetical protein
MAFERDKIDGLKRIMSYKSMEEIFSNEFNVKKGEWNDFLRRSIDKMQK